MRVTVAAAVRDGTRLFVGAVRGAVSCRVVGGQGVQLMIWMSVRYGVRGVDACHRAAGCLIFR